VTTPAERDRLRETLDFLAEVPGLLDRADGIPDPREIEVRARTARQCVVCGDTARTAFVVEFPRRVVGDPPVRVWFDACLSCAWRVKSL
jgi:hypothetical protein